MPLLNFVTDTSIDFNLRSQFLNVILMSFVNSLRNRTITSNSFHRAYEIEKTIKDDFWEVKTEEPHIHVDTIYPIMIKMDQRIDNMSMNFSLELQKMRFFNSMFKYNMFFDHEFDPDEWMFKVFDHCMKIIVIIITKYSKKLQEKKKHKEYEVTENFPQEYTSQRSVFDLHFWFRKVVNREVKGKENEDENIKIDESNSLSNRQVNEIMKEALEILHYYVEFRHKYLCCSVNEAIHLEIWNKINSNPDRLLSDAEIIEISNKVGSIVIEHVRERKHGMTHFKGIKSLNKLYNKFRNEIGSSQEVSLYLSYLGS